MTTTEYPTPAHPGHGIFVARQVETLRRLGVEIDVLHFISRASPANHWRAWQRMRRMMKTADYDLIHAQFGHAGIISRLQRRLPLVVTYRGDGLQGVVGAGGRHTAKGHVLVEICQFIGSMADEVIVVSERLGRILKRSDYHVIPSGIDLDRFRPIPREQSRQAIGWDLDRPMVLFSAQHIEWPNKRFALAQEAVNLAAEEVKGAELKVASGVKPDQMPLYMNAADALLLTSIQEGSPNVVKEALACNLPVVSVDVGDVSERLEGVPSGAICDANPRSLARALVPLLRNPTRGNSRESVTGLNDDALARRVIDVYGLATASFVTRSLVGAQR